MVRLGWVSPAETVQVAFGTSRAGAVGVALYRTAEIEGLVQEHPEADWERLRLVPKGRRSPLAALARGATAA
ncbi:hypothetical protein SUDANB38_05898 (plasmid) [Streptomyces sp. enrichment culture]